MLSIHIKLKNSHLESTIPPKPKKECLKNYKKLIKTLNKIHLYPI